MRGILDLRPTIAFQKCADHTPREVNRAALHQTVGLRDPPRAPRQISGQSYRRADDRMSRREHASPVLESNHRALRSPQRNCHPKEIVQGEELSIKGVTAALV